MASDLLLLFFLLIFIFGLLLKFEQRGGKKD